MKRLGASFAVFILLFTTVAMHAQVDKTTKDLEAKAEYAYILTTDKFNKLAEVGKAVSEWADNNEQTAERMEKDESLLDGTLTQRTRILNMKYLELTAIIRKHGLTTQEYLLGTQVLVHAMLLLDAKSQGKTKDYAKNVNPANLAFVEQHAAEIRKSIRFRM